MVYGQRLKIPTVSELEFDPQGKTSLKDFDMARFERFLRNQIALELERQATYAMISNQYNFNDTAVRAKTYHHAAEIVRRKPSE
jgi:hypothetical protein